MNARWHDGECVDVMSLLMVQPNRGFYRAGNGKPQTIVRSDDVNEKGLPYISMYTL